MKQNQIVITITDVDYFFMLDNQIRPSMMKYETEVLLPKAKRVLELTGVKVEDLQPFPTEGYYHETEDLRLYFQIIRNIQHNKEVYKKVQDSEDLRDLQKVCHNDLFGIEDPLKRANDSPLKRRYDILTLTLEDPTIFPDHNTNPCPWSIKRIMDGIGQQYKNRTNLVELAYLTREPKCLCCGAETNSLYRAIATTSGSYSLHASEPTYVWKVSPEVEELGRRIAGAYNNLIGMYVIAVPTLGNHTTFKKAPKVPRVALLGYVIASQQYYHWILDWTMRLTEIYSTNIITTESYTKNGGATKFYGNIYNGIPI